MLCKHLKLSLSVTSLLLFLVWMAPAVAWQVQLAWDAPTTNTDGTPVTDLAGYYLYSQVQGVVVNGGDFSLGSHLKITQTSSLGQKCFS